MTESANLYLDLMKRVLIKNGDTLVSDERLENIRHCIESALIDDIPGDFIETGVWRGGASMFARAVLKAHGVEDRLVWCADSFQGLPEPEAPEDAGSTHHELEHLKVPLDVVRQNFASYGLLDDRVKFIKGWFKDTLPTAPVERLAVLRLDGDMYRSTMDALVNLYPKVSPGGFTIIDDWCLGPCRQAVEHYRQENAIGDELKVIDGTAIYWRKTSGAEEG